MLEKRLRQQRGTLPEPYAMAEFRFREPSTARANIMRWISTFDRYDLILAAAISCVFAVALSLGFI
jgi:hypothetical protein